MKKIILLIITIFITQISATPKLTFPTFEKIILKNGLHIFYDLQKDNPLTYINVIIKTGQIDDPENKIGTAQLTLDLIDTHTKKYPNESIEEILSFEGTALQRSSQSFNSNLNIKINSKKAPIAYNIISSCLTEPQFSDKILAREKKQWITTLKEEKTNAEYISKKQALKLLFNQPHSIKNQPSIKSVSKINQSDINTFHKTYFTPENIEIYIIGNTSIKKIKKHLVEPLEKLNKGSKKIQKKIDINPKEELIVINKPNTTQTTITLLSQSPLLNTKEFYYHRMLNYVLGAASFSSRLTKSIRAKLGNTYSINSYFESEPKYGLFWINTFTKNETALLTLKEIHRCIDKIAKSGITETELQKAKSYYLGNLPIRYETPFQKTNRLIYGHLQGLNKQQVESELIYLNQLKLDEINTYIKTYFKTNKFKTTIVTNTEKIKLDELKSIYKLIQLKDVQ